jgi:hypothetical protein
VQSLDLDWSSIDNDDLANIASLTELIGLGMSYTTVTDGGIRHLTGLRSLGYLDLSETKVTDLSLAELFASQELTSLKSVVTGDIHWKAELAPWERTPERLSDPQFPSHRFAWQRE